MARTTIAYWTTMLLAGAFVFCSILCVQGIAAQLFSRRMFLRISGVLQLGAFCLALTLFFLQPKLATPAALQAPQNQWVLTMLPSYWFIGIFQDLNGTAHEATAPLSQRAWIGLLVAACGAGAAFAVSYFRTIRRIVDEPDIVPGSGSAKWWPCFGDSLQTAVVRFSARTLLRSSQHRVILAVYLGIGFAITLAYARNLLYGNASRPWHQVNGPLLASSIVLLCFAVVGVRVIFAMPLALRANWIFRITAISEAPMYFASVRRALLVIAVAPVWALCAAGFVSIWPAWQAVGHLVVLGLLGCIVTDLALSGFHKIPFACSYLPGKAGIHVTSGAFAIALLALTDLGVQIELRALRDPGAYLKLIIVLAVVLAWLIRRTASQNAGADLKFEEIPEADIFALELHRDGTMPPVPVRGD